MHLLLRICSGSPRETSGHVQNVARRYLNLNELNTVSSPYQVHCSGTADFRDTILFVDTITILRMRISIHSYLLTPTIGIYDGPIPEIMVIRGSWRGVRQSLTLHLEHMRPTEPTQTLAVPYSKLCLLFLHCTRGGGDPDSVLSTYCPLYTK